ncbi:hypothetical protein SSS_04448 [Sarcoptes scabiei]|uniref:Uncharacterized protein n=1 Tax=Sarcoptes scabiei TaxID=52283 RepID=A0A834R1V5_SARSC|nr:hypothetical protein SSS_04448 [Sarcoptes scabiei]
MCKTTAIVYRKVPHTIIKKVPVIKEVIKTIKVPVYVERHHHHRHRLDDKISYPIAKIYDPHPPHQGHQQQVHHILSDRYQSKFDKIHHNQIPMANKNYLDDNELGEFDRGFLPFYKSIFIPIYNDTFDGFEERKEIGMEWNLRKYPKLSSVSRYRERKEGKHLAK